MDGKINSYQTMGTVDGPGVRFVVFMQGCPLRCIYCHNPETWEQDSDITVSPFELLERVKRYKNYFTRGGGVTVSGGEPLMQQEFLEEFFSLCKKENINTALDTSGSIINSMTESVLKNTDLVLLDLKFTTEDEYKKYTGGSLKQTLDFLSLAEKMNVEVWLRQVVVKGINDNFDNIKRLREIASAYKNVSKTELLPYKNLCIEKYERLNIPFELKDYPQTTEKDIEMLNLIKNT